MLYRYNCPLSTSALRLPTAGSTALTVDGRLADGAPTLVKLNYWKRQLGLASSFTSLANHLTRPVRILYISAKPLPSYDCSW